MQIWRFIVGRSQPVAELRAADGNRSSRFMLNDSSHHCYRCLHAWPTLIIGPSGSGKGLVAQAIGMSRYCEFDQNTGTFPDYSPPVIYPINLAGVSTTQLESKIFGYRQGSFDGATTDFDGILTRCGNAGTVFLDGIGDANTSIQIKLLRVLQTRRFLPIGGTEELSFNGKIISALDCDLVERVERGDFRQDFYFRLCGDIIVTPPLREQLSDYPEDLPLLVCFILERELGCSISSNEECPLVGEISDWIRKHVGDDYHWPGNIRELEQCAGNILFHGKYLPMQRPPNSHNQKFHGFRGPWDTRFKKAEECLRNTGLRSDSP